MKQDKKHGAASKNASSTGNTYSLPGSKSKLEMKEIVSRAHHQKDDIPAPRITLDIGQGTEVRKRRKSREKAASAAGSEAGVGGGVGGSRSRQEALEARKSRQHEREHEHGMSRHSHSHVEKTASMVTQHEHDHHEHDHDGRTSTVGVPEVKSSVISLPSVAAGPARTSSARATVTGMWPSLVASNAAPDVNIGSEPRFTTLEVTPQAAAQQRQDQLHRQRNLRKVLKQEAKLIKRVNRPPNDHVIKHQVEFVRRRENELGPYFQKERDIAQAEKDAAKPKRMHRSAFGRSVVQTKSRALAVAAMRARSTRSRFTSYSQGSQSQRQSTFVSLTTMGGASSTTTIHALTLPSVALSQQTLEGDVRMNQHNVQTYNRLINPHLVKRYNRPAPKLPKLGLWKYLHTWDVSSSAKRDSMILKFLEHYTTLDPVDMDSSLSFGGSLIFARFVVAMQLCYARRKPIWHYFQALGLFLKSLQCERYVYEFCLMGGFNTAFSALKMDEMRVRDKANVLYFLYRAIDGPNGARVKSFICRESTFLDSVVDTLTMCNNVGVIHFAQLFLENMCVSTKMESLSSVVNYVIGLLPCDFNPRVQIMACEVLQFAVHQKPPIAAQCFEYVVDVLKTDYDPILVPVGNLCISIMSTPTADDLLTKLINVVEPQNLHEDSADGEGSGGTGGRGVGESYRDTGSNLGRRSEEGGGEDMGGAGAAVVTAASGVEIPEMLQMVRREPSDEFDDEKESEMTLLDLQTMQAAAAPSAISGDRSFFERPGAKSNADPDKAEKSQVHAGRTGGRLAAALNADMFYRQQLGSIFVLSFMLKNRTDFAEWMMQKGIVGNLLTAIGSSSYHRVQLSAVRLLLLLHDLSPDCGAALQFLIPDQLLVMILEKGERFLEHITAVHCLILRKLGRLVKKHWLQWFDHVVLKTARDASIISSIGSAREEGDESLESDEEEETDGEGEGEEEATIKASHITTVESRAERTKSKSKSQSYSNRKSRFSSAGPVVERSIESILLEIQGYTEQLEALCGTSFDHVMTTMDLLIPDPDFFGSQEPIERGSTSAMRLTGKPTELLSVGEVEILTKEHLEKFRKYLNRNEKESEDEFEKYYAAKFGAESEVADMTGMEQAALIEAERAIVRLKQGTGTDTVDSDAEDGGGAPVETPAASSEASFSAAAERNFSTTHSSMGELDELGLNLDDSKDLLKFTS